MVQHRALGRLGVISALLLNVWVAPADVYALPKAGSNDSVPQDTGSSGSFSWDSIVPSPHLVWHQCYGDFECARLQVPLDYLAENPNEDHAYLAVIKYASDPVNHPEYSESWGGPVLTNPGGPGGSGVEQILYTGPDLQKSVGSQFSIVGWDPRGVNFTRPEVSCFDTPYDRLLWQIKGGGRMVSSGSSTEELGELYVRGKVMGSLCTAGQKGKDAQYIGTASTARDMLSINEAIWDLAPNTTVARKGVQYWGFSYGSALGITFATMFPDKVERMIVDGVLNVIDYFSGTWSKMMTDTEEVMDSFYKYCSEAGPDRCAFYTGSKPEDIQGRLANLLEALRTQPLPYTISSDGINQPDIFTYSHLRSMIAVALYTPLLTFSPLAEFLVLVESSLELGNLTAGPIVNPLLTCSPNAYEDIFNNALLLGEAQYSITCGDMPSLTNMTLADFTKKKVGLEEQSPTSGDFWAMKMLPCVGRTTRAKELPPSFEKPTAKWGGAPIMFIGNTGDPVTPLENAYSMAKLFPANASAVMVQEGEGHCSYTVPSECITSAVQAYFATGMAPPEDKRFCSRVEAPFVGPVSRSQKRSEAINAMSRVGQWLHRKSVEPRALPLALFS